MTKTRAPRRTCATFANPAEEAAAELATLESSIPQLTWKRGMRPGLRRNTHHAAFWDWPGGILAGEGGGVLTFPARAPLAALLGAVAAMPEGRRPRTIYLTGPDLADHRPAAEWWREPVAEGWQLETTHSDKHTRTDHAELSRDGVVVAVRLAAEWFDAETDARALAAAWRRLRGELCAAFGEHSYLYPTSAATGLYLAELSLPFGQTYPVLPDGLRRLVHAENTQGRIELLTLPELDTLPGLVDLDGRWMYASCCRHLPAGPYTYDATDDYAEYVPGFYRVMARVPKDWTHIGLLPLLTKEGKEYPSEPGRAFLTWATGAEVALAREYGWVKRIQRRLLWWEKADPLRGLVEKLRTLRGETRGEANLSAAYRNILLHGVGALATRSRTMEGISPYGAPVPPGAFSSPREDGVHWKREIDAVHSWSHPEWAATVWGRTRARVARAALQLPREELIAIRTDGIWTTRDPGWEDDGKPGAFRVKSPQLAGEIAAPHSTDALLRLMREARAESEAE